MGTLFAGKRQGALGPQLDGLAEAPRKTVATRGDVIGREFEVSAIVVVECTAVGAHRIKPFALDLAQHCADGIDDGRVSLGRRGVDEGAFEVLESALHPFKDRSGVTHDLTVRTFLL